MDKKTKFDILRIMVAASGLTREEKNECIDFVTAYEKAEENGMLIHLPCRVGDKVWTITSPANYSLGAYAEVVLEHPQEKKIQSITITKNGLLFHVKGRNFGSHDFGKTVFLTREAAEQALKQMGE